jgi:hypothetical protein
VGAQVSRQNLAALQSLKHRSAEFRSSTVGGVTDVRNILVKDRVGRSADSDHLVRGEDGDEALRPGSTAFPFSKPGSSIAKRIARLEWMGRHGVPKNHVMLGIEVVEDVVHDRRGWLGPALRHRTGRSVLRVPLNELSLGGEGNSGPPHSSVTGRLADSQDPSGASVFEVAAKVGKTDSPGRLGFSVEEMPVREERKRFTEALGGEVFKEGL